MTRRRAFAYGSDALNTIRADASGQCNENNFVGFGEVTQSSSCVRVLDPTAIASDCHSLFGAYR